MVDVVARPDAGLPELLSDRAHAASSRRLALDLLLGASAALLSAAWRPPAWPALCCAALCFAAFGAWGTADRRLHRARGRAVEALPLGRSAASLHVPAWRALRGLAALVGTLAAAGLVLATLFGTLGRWIS